MEILYTPKEAAAYSEFIERSYSWKYMERPAVLKNLHGLINEDCHILDAGCGTGHTIQLAIDMGAKPGNVIGADISPYMLQIAQRALPNVNFVEANFPDLAFRENSLDLVFSVMMFNYLDQAGYERAIKNIYDWLKGGGCLFFVTLHPFRYKHDYEDYFIEKKGIEDTPWGTKIEYYHKTISGYLNPLINASFDLECVEELKPVSEESKCDREMYNIYSNIPTRLAVKAIKK